MNFNSIGTVRTNEKNLPRHWSMSDVEGRLEIDSQYLEGMQDIEAGQHIVVLFCFHKSAGFTAALLRQTPPGRSRPKGVFSICSPRRPNPIGMSVLEVLDVDGDKIRVKGLDMFDGTPILDIKPHIPLKTG